jgi:hypothetical protein
VVKKPALCGIRSDVFVCLFELPLALNDPGRISIAEHMSMPVMAKVEPLRVSTVESLHEDTQIGASPLE